MARYGFDSKISCQSHIEQDKDIETQKEPMQKQRLSTRLTMNRTSQQETKKGPKQFEVPRNIKYGASVDKFLRKLDSAYKTSQKSSLVFK